MVLLTCQACARHVRAGSTSCPFCGGASLLTAQPFAPRRVRRAVMLAGAASVAVACGATEPAPPAAADAGKDAPTAFDAAYGGPPIDAGQDAPLVFYGAPPLDSSVPPDSGKD